MPRADSPERLHDRFPEPPLSRVPVRALVPNERGDEARYERLMSKATEPYFVLKAGNGEIIGTSHMYSSDSARDQGISSCRENGPTAATQDDTAK